jgi:phytanoyl-CoA hydroxylase
MKDGFVNIPQLFSHDRIDELRDEMSRLINNSSEDERERAKWAIFSTKKQIENLSKNTDYFLDSGANISYFFEEDCVDEDGNLSAPMDQALNKVGHAMHDLNSKFESFCYSDEIKSICNKVFEYQAPILV